MFAVRSFFEPHTVKTVVPHAVSISTQWKKSLIHPNLRKAVELAAVTAEVMYGERSHKEETNILERDHKLGKKYYPIADKTLEGILAKVGRKHEYAFKLFVLKDSGGMRLPGYEVSSTSIRA